MKKPGAGRHGQRPADDLSLLRGVSRQLPRLLHNRGGALTVPWRVDGVSSPSRALAARQRRACNVCDGRMLGTVMRCAAVACTYLHFHMI